jgi:hypothetical protein
MVWSFRRDRDRREIKEEQDYEGVRVKFVAQVDVGFGDAVTPGLLGYPILLVMWAPLVHSCPRQQIA